MIEETIEKGDAAQRRIQESLNTITYDTFRATQLAYETNAKLKRQIDQLAEMKGTVKETGSALDRSKKHIRYFLTALECDPCLLILIVLILLAAIALITLVALK